MNVFEALRNPLALPVSSKVAAVLILSLLFWATGAPGWLNKTKASSFYDASDTLTDSDLAVTSGHTFTFSVPSRISTNAAGTATGTIAFTLDPNTSRFTVGQLARTDFSATSSITIVSTCSDGNPATNKVLLSTTSVSFTFSLCASNVIATSTAGVSFFIASSTGHITNPSIAGSYDIDVSSTDQGTAKDSTDFEVAIIDDVVVTASVDTTFSFTINGVIPGTSINGTTTTAGITTTGIAIPFGTLTAGIPKVLGQRLNVTTNASNGFTVTVQADQTLTSSNGDTVDVFADGSGVVAPTAWTAPSGSFGSVNTYGHWGITTDDATLVGGDTFGTALFAGNFSTSTPVAVFYHNAPADGTTNNIGSTSVAYAIQTTSFQEAADDYTATLTYVATPVF